MEMVWIEQKHQHDEKLSSRFVAMTCFRNSIVIVGYEHVHPSTAVGAILVGGGFREKD